MVFIPLQQEQVRKKITKYKQCIDGEYILISIKSLDKTRIINISRKKMAYCGQNPIFGNF